MVTYCNQLLPFWVPEQVITMYPQKKTLKRVWPGKKVLIKQLHLNLSRIQFLKCIGQLHRLTLGIVIEVL